MRIPRMLFVRRYHGILGGHLKVFQYIAHVVASGRFEPVLYTTPESQPIETEYLMPGIVRTHEIAPADAYFVAGNNWAMLDAAGIDTSGKPVVNLLQGFAHVREGDPRRSYLSRPALRICVSDALETAVLQAGLANGPVVTVRNGTELDVSSDDTRPRDGIFVAAMKNAQFGERVANELAQRGIRFMLETQFVERSVFLGRLRQSAVAVLIPHPEEGFYLPALEAMALGCAVVIPGVMGLSSHCINERSALVCAFDEEDVANAATRLARDGALRHRLVEGGRSVARAHSLERERTSFISMMDRYLS